MILNVENPKTPKNCHLGWAIRPALTGPRPRPIKFLGKGVLPSLPNPSSPLSQNFPPTFFISISISRSNPNPETKTENKNRYKRFRIQKHFCNKKNEPLQSRQELSQRPQSLQIGLSSQTHFAAASQALSCPPAAIRRRCRPTPPHWAGATHQVPYSRYPTAICQSFWFKLVKSWLFLRYWY